MGTIHTHTHIYIYKYCDWDAGNSQATMSHIHVPCTGPVTEARPTADAWLKSPNRWLKIPPAPSVYGKWLCAEGKQGNLQQIGQQLLRLQVERSGTPDSQVISRTLSLGVRWSHNCILDPYGISVFLTYYKSLDLEVNGGGLETRRCRRRISRAATTRTLPLERMLPLPRQSMTRLDLRRAAAVARSHTVRLEV